MNHFLLFASSQLSSALVFDPSRTRILCSNASPPSSHSVAGAVGGRRQKIGRNQDRIFVRSRNLRSRRNQRQAKGSKDAPTSERLAVVTGANKGIGLEITRQLALAGVTAVLTARDEKRGANAVESLRRDHGLSDVVFHQLDVQDPASAASLHQFIQAEYGKLDILVNNAGASGVSVDVKGLKALNIDPISWLSGKVTNQVQGVINQTYDGALTCFDTNYYGCKRVTEALLPLLKLSTSGARVVNVSSLRSELKRMPSERIKHELNDIENLNEEKIEKLLESFLEDLKNGRLEDEGWPTMLPSYSVSKMVLNAYTRVLARRWPDMRINCVHPGYVKTDINWNTGVITAQDGARGPVMLALLPAGGPSGCYFDQTNMAEF